MLIEAGTIKLEPDHGHLVKILWRNHPDAKRVQKHDLLTEMAVHDERLEVLLNDLLSLGIIDLDEGEWVVKRESIVLLA